MQPRRGHGGGRKSTDGWKMLQIRRYILSARFEMENQKNIEKKQKKTYFRSLVDRGPPKGARLEWKTKKTSRKPKNKKKQYFRSLGDRGRPQRVLEYCFFCFSRGFFWVFSRFVWFSPRGPPQRVLEYCFFFFSFFVFFGFSRVFFDFL